MWTQGIAWGLDERVEECESVDPEHCMGLRRENQGGIKTVLMHRTTLPEVSPSTTLPASSHPPGQKHIGPDGAAWLEP